MDGFNPVDVALALVLLVSAAIGAWRGLLYEVLSLLSWVAAFLAAQAWSTEMAAILPLAQVGEPWQTMAGFLTLFVAVAFLGGFIAWLVQKLTKQIGLRPVDRTLGAVFGAARGLLLVSIVVLVVGFTPWASHQVWTSAHSVQSLSGWVQQLKVWLPESLNKI
jgi:membrane protein required for colicin V production